MSLGFEAVPTKTPNDTVLKQWSEQICTAAVEKRSLVIEGNGSKHFYGRPINGAVLKTTDYSGVIAYEPSELVITAKAGTPLSEIEAVLSETGQMLAFEPPKFDGEPTIGGVVAAGISGPRRSAAGSVRDYVLGAQILNGKGTVLSFGGQVMKNVAGYDISRLLAGSLGCLGVLTEVSLKVVPAPRLERTLKLELNQSKALEFLTNCSRKALPVSASLWVNDCLWIRLSASAPEVKTAQNVLGGELLDDRNATDFWTSVRDHQHAFFKNLDENALLLRAALPDTVPAIPVVGEQLIEWRGGQRWLTAPERAACALFCRNPRLRHRRTAPVRRSPA